MNRREFLKLAAGAVAGVAAALAAAALKPVGRFLPQQQQEEIPATLGNNSPMLVDYTAGSISAGDVRRRIDQFLTDGMSVKDVCTALADDYAFLTGAGTGEPLGVVSAPVMEEAA